MERQNRLVMALSLVLLALVAIVVFTKSPEKGADDDGPAEHAAFQEWKSDEVTRLELTRAGTTLAFARVDGAWTMEAPKKVPVDDRKVDEVVDKLVGVRLQERTMGADAATYELGPDQRVDVALTRKDGTVVHLFVGRDAPVGYAAYVQERADGPVLVSTSQLQSLVRRGVDDFRTRTLWKVSAGTAKRAVIEDGSTKVILRKDDHGWWLGDAGPRVSGEAVEGWLSELSTVSADALLDEVDPATIGLAQPSASVTLEDADGTHVLRFGSTTPEGVHAQGDGPPARVPATARTLVKTDGWLDTELLPVRRWEVDHVEIELDGVKKSYTKADGVWKNAAGASVDGVDRLFDAIAAVKVDRTLAAGPVSALAGAFTLGQGTTRVETVQFSAAGKDGTRVGQDRAGGPPFVVDGAALAAVISAAP